MNRLAPERNEAADDAACMAAIVAGSASAFKAVMDAHMTSVFRYAYSVLGDAALAEDVTQETFSRLWSQAARWMPKGRVKSWLLKIAHNLCIDEIRRTRSHIDIDAVEPVLPDTARGPRENMAREQTADIVRQALFALPERQRAALVLVHYHDRTNIEAADIMGVSVDALESLLARGRRTMKDVLAGQKVNLLGE